MQRHYYYVYIICNKKNGTLYTGVTKSLIKRMWEHKNKSYDGFSKKYNLTKLVYFEVFHDIHNAISREKQIKSGSRKNKLKLIEKINHQWEDYSKDWYL